MVKTSRAAVALGMAIWLVAGLGLAQDNAEYERHEFTGFGCALDLPVGGELSQPGSAGWDAEPQVAAMWSGAAGAPVALIMVRVDTMDQPLNAAAFTTFCDTLLGNWTDDPEKFTVITSNEELAEGQFTWNLIEVEDMSAADTPVYYSVFSTYAGSKIYTLSMYYLRPIDDSVSEYGAPVLKSFELLAD